MTHCVPNRSLELTQNGLVPRSQRLLETSYYYRVSDPKLCKHTSRPMSHHHVAMQVVMYLIRMQAHVKTYVTSSCSDASSDVLDTNASCDVLDLPLRHPLPLPFLSLSVCGFLSTPCSCLSRSPPTCCSLTLDSLSLVASPLPFFSPSLSLCHIAPPPLTRPRSHPPPRYADSSSSSSSPKSSSLRLSLSRSLSLCLLECIELSSMVDFSMGTINSMVGYMTSGHGPLHVPRN